VGVHDRPQQCAGKGIYRIGHARIGKLYRTRFLQDNPDQCGIDALKDGHGYFAPQSATVKEIFKNQLRIKTRTVLDRNIFMQGEELPDWFYKVKFGDVPLSMILGHYGNFWFINEPMAVSRQTGKGVSTFGSENRLFGFNHLIAWIEIWEYGANYYYPKYRQESISTILHFYNKIHNRYNYSVIIFFMCVNYALFKSKFSLGIRVSIFSSLFMHFIKGSIRRIML
jgi:hypothetical protein